MCKWYFKKVLYKVISTNNQVDFRVYALTLTSYIIQKTLWTEHFFFSVFYSYHIPMHIVHVNLYGLISVFGNLPLFLFPFYIFSTCHCNTTIVCYRFALRCRTVISYYRVLDSFISIIRRTILSINPTFKYKRGVFRRHHRPYFSFNYTKLVPLSDSQRSTYSIHTYIHVYTYIRLITLNVIKLFYFTKKN